MNISKLFIQRPVMTLVLTIAVIVFGWFAYQALPISELPEIDFATISVSASLPGADPETMANAVATPLEKQFSAIAGLDSMTSTNSQGQTSITLQFALDRNIDAAAQDVQTAIAQTSKSLPADMTNPPTMRKVNPASSPIIFLALTGDNIPLTTLDEYAQTYIAQRLSMVNGVAQVQVFGSQQYAVRIHLNPSAMAARNLSSTDIIEAIKAANTNQPAGTLRTPERTYAVKTSSPYTDAISFNQAIIGFVGGAAVRLKDVGYAEDSVANNQAAAWYDKHRAIILAIQRQPGSNTVAVADAIHQLLPELTQKLPGGAKLHIVYDRSEFIRAALNEMKFTLILAIVLVAGIILLFLGRIAPTIIAMLSLPVSLIATFGLMYVLGYSIDNLSLMGLILAVGFIVDDAIVVLENIVRYLEQGFNRMEAALKGSQEIFFTVISMTISLVAVFIPILFMGGLLGRLFHEFAVVVGISILISGIVALTLTPMLCSRLLRQPNAGNTALKRDESSYNTHSLFPWFERLFIQSKNFYEQSLRSALNHSKGMLIMTGVVLVLTIGLFGIVSKGFIPSEDTGFIMGMTKVPVGLPYSDLVKRQQTVAEAVRATPGVEQIISVIGQGRNGGNTNGGQLHVRLKPPSERDLTADEIISQLRRSLQKIPGIQTFFQNPPAIQAGPAVSSSNYQYVLQGHDLQQLQTASVQLQQQMAQLPGIRDVNSDLDLSNPEVRVKILYDRAAALGVTADAIQTALYDAYGTRQISTIYTPTDEYQVIADIDTEHQRHVNSLNTIYARSGNGSLVPLSALVELEQGTGPISVNHYGQLPAVMLSFNLATGASLGAVTQEIEALAKTVLPAGVTGTFAGSALAFKDSLRTLPLLLLMTIFVIYVVLAILYEHFIHPITILTALPFASFGALLMLMLFHLELDIFSFIGIIMLVGLVKKNGIMMVDFAIEARRTQNLSAYDAIVQACLTRFRPIMMTTMTAILATLPLAIGLGTGGEARRPMGVAVVGGLLFSQMLTLYVTPVFYLVLDNLSRRGRKRIPDRQSPSLLAGEED
ncbi:MAG TPA: efflux RND transporter permease subunit [Gammaproteobacteria bacterium]|nr:efflux RND transporter permease subunit [Gammaproteobacteria bacterium]